MTITALRQRDCRLDEETQVLLESWRPEHRDGHLGDRGDQPVQPV